MTDTLPVYFEPTKQMMACARAARQWDYRPEHKKLWCEKAETHIKTYRNWVNHVAGFEEWWNEKAIKHAKRQSIEKDVYGTPEYSPTALQIKFLDACTQDGFLTPPNVMWRELDMGRLTFSGWQREPKFKAWWKRQVRNFFEAFQPGVYAEITKAAIAGNVNDRRLFLEVFDEDFVRKDAGARVSFDGMLLGAVRGFFYEGTDREASGPGEVYSIPVASQDEGPEGRRLCSIPVQRATEGDSPRTKKASEAEAAGSCEDSQE